MTAATAALCGHRWARRARCAYTGTIGGHRCDRGPGHQHNPGLSQHYRHRCQCGATTTREDPR